MRKSARGHNIETPSLSESGLPISTMPNFQWSSLCDRLINGGASLRLFEPGSPMPAIRRYIFRALTVLTVIAPMPFLASPSAAQDVARGAVVFKRCQICHSTTAAGGSTIGPNLSGVLGRKAGAQKGFTYSKAMASAGFLWDAKKLDAFMAKPQSVVPGNRMAFGGIAADAQRADLLAYLKSLGK